MFKLKNEEIPSGVLEAHMTFCHHHAHHFSPLSHAYDVTFFKLITQGRFVQLLKFDWSSFVPSVWWWYPSCPPATCLYEKDKPKTGLAGPNDKVLMKCCLWWLLMTVFIFKPVTSKKRLSFIHYSQPLRQSLIPLWNHKQHFFVVYTSSKTWFLSVQFCFVFTHLSRAAPHVVGQHGD